MAVVRGVAGREAVVRAKAYWAAVGKESVGTLAALMAVAVAAQEAGATSEAAVARKDGPLARVAEE